MQKPTSVLFSEDTPIEKAVARFTEKIGEPPMFLYSRKPFEFPGIKTIVVTKGIQPGTYILSLVEFVKNL